MDKIRILCHVAAQFKNARGEIIHDIPSSMRHVIHDAPAEIQEDIQFRWLINEGFLEIALSPTVEKQLAMDPLQGTDAEGKKPKALKAEKADKFAKPDPSDPPNP